MKMLEYYNLTDFNHDTLDDAKIKRHIDLMKEKYIAHWKHTVQNSPKLKFYSIFKSNYTPSIYLDLTRKNPDRKALVKLRISNHKRKIETGRYEKVSRCDRLCTLCGLNNIEYEIHFLFHCPNYSSIRDGFYNKIDNKFSNFKQLPLTELIIELLNSSDYFINIQLVKLISPCIDLRNKLLSV